MIVIQLQDVAIQLGELRQEATGKKVYVLNFVDPSGIVVSTQLGEKEAGELGQALKGSGVIVPEAVIPQDATSRRTD